MFFKSFKKAIALLVAAVFLMSLIPVVGMAEDVSIALTNYANTRGGSYANDEGCIAWSSYPSYQKVQNGSNNNSWHMYGQFDLSGYEEILGNEGTSVTFKINVGGPASSGKQKNFEIYLIDDTFDDYRAESLTHNLAESLGMFDAINSGVVIGSAADEEYAPKGLYEVSVPAQTILDVLKGGSDNSIVTLAFTTKDTNGTAFNASTCTLTIDYNSGKVDNALYAKEIVDGINWSDLSSEAQNAVTQDLNLPTKLYGADISWSSNSGAINSAGEVTQSYNKESVTIIATARYKDKTASRSFDVTVDKMTYNYTDVYTGDNADRDFVYISGSASNYIKVDAPVCGVAGKAKDDAVYSVHDLGGDSNYLNYRFGDVFDPQKNNDVMEFSVFLPDGTENVKFEGYILNKNAFTSGSGTAQLTISYNIKSDGLYYNDTWKIYETKQNEWYNIAFVAPKGMKTPGVVSDGDDLTAKLYVNGELAHAITCSEPTAYGLRAFRFYGFDASLTDPGYYLDNMRLYSGEYIPENDKIPSGISSVYNIENGVITLPGNVSAGQLKASVTKEEDTDIRIYGSETNMSAELLDNAVLSSGCILVAATTNGTNLERGYSYYRIEKLDYSIEADILADGISSKVFGNSDLVSAGVVFNNYCADTQNVMMYVAQYKNNELIGLWQDDESISAGESKVLSTDMNGFADKENSTLKLMLVYKDTLKPCIKPVISHYREDGDTPVLYLVGDSIVQEYDKGSYPKQGWGKYIANYLDGINVDNRARSGWTTDHYVNPSSRGVSESERYKTWESISGEVKPGDFIMVSLGINDSGSGNVPKDRYIENISTIYNEAIQKGASVILSTPTISGRDWNSGSSFMETWGGYGDLCQEFAKTNDSVCLPLGETLVKTYNKTALDYMDENGVSYIEALNYTRNLYHLYSETIKLPESEGGFGVSDYSKEDDATHLNENGANRIAKIIAELMLNSESDISSYVKID